MHKKPPPPPQLPPPQLPPPQAHSDFWGSRLGPISALRFHPTQQLLATGAANDHLSVFSYEASSWTAVM